MTTASLRPARNEPAAPWTRAVFAAGDYAGVAMFGDASTFEYHAARAMILGDRASFAALRDFTAVEARLHHAAARWIHGDTAGARRELVGLGSPHAQNLARLLDQPRIAVLSQLPWQDDVPTDLLGAVRHDAQFEVRNVGHRAPDVQNVPYADVARYLDAGFVPDFYLAAMVEWQHVPPNLQSLPCPIFGHIADHDLHIQALQPWLPLFDELCVTDRTEWLDVQGLGRGRVTSFPKVFGLPGNLPEPAHQDRHLDFFVSGTMLDPYHPDKSRLLHELLAMQDIDLRVVRGFAGTMAFHALLSASKASFTYVRRGGAMPTRGLESLAMGCALALQEESVLNLWVGREHGITNYGPTAGSLSAAVRRILTEWREYGPAALRGAAVVRSEFALRRTASQYFRFLTFRAAAPREARRQQPTTGLCQKRLCVAKTWLPDSPVVRRRTMQANFRRLGECLATRPNATVIVDMARELLAEFAFYADRKQAASEDRALFDDAIALLEKCCRLFDRHLVARFVLVRALLHYGDAGQRMRALQLAHDTIQLDPAGWQVAPSDDVMPFDFHGEFFNYRDYFDLATKAARGDCVPASAFVRLLLASLAGYVARKTGKPGLHALAVQWDPEFARYRLDWARALLDRSGPEGRAQAVQLLQELAAGSVEFARATRLLQELGESFGRSREADALARRALQRLEQDTIDAALDTAALFRTERRAAAEARTAGLLPAASAPPAGTRIAVLVPEAGTVCELTALLTEIEGQTHTPREVVVAIAPSQRELSAAIAAWSATSLRVAIAPVPEGASFVERTNWCLGATDAPLLAFAMPGDCFRPDALERLCNELELHEDAGLSFASEGWTDRKTSRFDPSACVAVAFAPPFAPRRLLESNAIGLHPVWRRALHERLGGFDPHYGAAAEYEFWLRATANCAVRQLPMLLSTSRLDTPARRERDPVAAGAGVLQARRDHFGTEQGPLFPFRAQFLLPVVLFAPGMADEAQSHARLGIIAGAAMREVQMLEAFYGTALMHGDHATALCMLRAATACVPSLLSARLAEVNLLEALGLPGVAAVLEAARDCAPYGQLVERRLASLRTVAAPARGAAIPDSPSAKALPCPT